MNKDARVFLAALCSDRGYYTCKEKGSVFVISPDKRMRIYFKSPIVYMKTVKVNVILKEEDIKDNLCIVDKFEFISSTDEFLLKSNIDKMLDDIEYRFCMKKTFSLPQQKLKSELERIASRRLGISTLECQNSDSLDFHEVSVWGIEAALMDAYNLGCNSKK